MLILAIIVFGLAIGWVAQLILGQGSKLHGVTLFAGLAGSFVGGLVISLLSGDGLNLRATGIIGSLLGAIIVLAVWGAVSKRSAA
jgi:uncharacterized membrane protein YeaQ/YmgE (transglycosylase-associated protein family)